MSQPYEHTDYKKDESLAVFADQVLDEKGRPSASNSDEELLSLEKTILRLKDAFPSTSLTDADTKRMLVRFKARLRREEQRVKPSFWKRLFDFQSNPQVGMLLAAAAALVLVMLSIPLLTPPGTGLSGTASSASPFLIGIAALGLLFVIYWVSRRK